MSIAGCRGTTPLIELQPAVYRPPEALAAQQARYDNDIYPFFDEFCFRCHGDRKQEGGIQLSEFTHVRAIGEEPQPWERVLNMLETGQMPPADRPQPTEADRDEIAAFIEDELDTAVRAMRPDPGRVTARRLNRQEYDNTIRDLLGVESSPARAFPVDDSGYGFDNIGDVLTVSPYLMEKYLAAAEDVVDEAMTAELESNEDHERANAGDELGEAETATETETTEGEGEEDPPERHIFVCGHSPGEHRRGCGKRIVRELAKRAYRRPVTKREVRQLTKLVDLAEDEGESFEDGIRLAAQAILVSPNFLFRIERDQRPDDPESLRYLNDFELASRLSYFLWSTMPDEELFTLARNGTLSDHDVLAEQVDRMISDEKAWEFIENFTGQWLELRNLRYAGRNSDLFPTYSRALRNAMRTESELFFNAVLHENLSILTFLDSDFTFVNDVLAEHYGLDPVEGDEFQRVPLPPGSQRGGVLTQASILTLTSYSRRTSPVIRGKWVLENILGTPPPPPPASVPAIPQDPAEFPEETIRAKLEAHRAQAECATCHNRIDPLGFGLENYDPIGKWRTDEHGLPIDASGVLPAGQEFDGSAELRQILLDEPDDFIRCFTEKMLTYALGRGIEAYDRPVVAAITDRLAGDDYRFQNLIREIVFSVPFQMRRGEATPDS